MIEKLLVTSAEVVQTVFTCRRFDKPIFRTPSVANKLHFAAAAVFGECIAFIGTEFALERRIHHLLNGVFCDVAYMIVRRNEMIAGVEIAVMLNSECVAARFVEDTEAWVVAQPRFQRDIKNLHENSADVVDYPLIKDRAEEFTVLPCRDRARGYIFSTEILNRRDKLHKLRTEAFEVVINLFRILGVVLVHDTQYIVINFVILQNAKPANDLFGRWTPAFVVAVFVVDFWRSVDTYPDQESVPLEKFTPFIVKECRVRLKRVLYLHAGTSVFLLVSDRLSEEVYTHQCWFAALPCKRNFVDFLRLNVLLDVIFQDCVIHPKGSRFRVEFLFIKIEAVFTIQVAYRSDRFRHDMKCARCVLLKHLIILFFYDLVVSFSNMPNSLAYLTRIYKKKYENALFPLAMENVFDKKEKEL